MASSVEREFSHVSVIFDLPGKKWEFNEVRREFRLAPKEEYHVKIFDVYFNKHHHMYEESLVEFRKNLVKSKKIYSNLKNDIKIKIDNSFYYDNLKSLVGFTYQEIVKDCLYKETMLNEDIYIDDILLCKIPKIKDCRINIDDVSISADLKLSDVWFVLNIDRIGYDY